MVITRYLLTESITKLKLDALPIGTEIYIWLIQNSALCQLTDVERQLCRRYPRTNKPEKAYSELPATTLPTHKHTVYISVVDKDRNACSFINTVFHSFGAE